MSESRMNVLLIMTDHGDLLGAHGLCNMAEVDSRAKADQRWLRQELAASGRQFRELEALGLRPDQDRLVNTI